MANYRDSRLINNVKCVPYKNDYTPNRNMVIGNFTPSDFTGSDPQLAVNWTLPVLNAQQNSQVEHPLLQFQPNDMVNLPQTCYGYFLQDENTLPFALLHAFRFPTPILLDNVGIPVPCRPVIVVSSQ